MLPESTILALAAELLGAPIEEGGYAPCPGAHLHTTAPGRRDFRVTIGADGMPHGTCFHASCAAERDAFFSRLFRAIRAAERGNSRSSAPAITTTPPPARSKTVKPVLNLALAEQIAAACPRDITPQFLRAVSPVCIPPEPERWPALLIDTLYRPGERVLIFDKFASQGQYIRVAGGKNYRLSARPGVQATPVLTLPDRGEDGVWYLAAPVTGQWLPNPNNIDPRTKQPKLSRRHAACCTRYPFAVLESDELPPETWLRILSQVEDYPVMAVYTSGGKSIHALLHLADCTTPAEFNKHRHALIQRFGRVGADVAAITPVRLTRLPGPLRLSKTDAAGNPRRQELLFLARRPEKKPLYARRPLRQVN